MTMQRFLMWYVGAVLFAGTVGASGYHILSRNHRQLAAGEISAQFRDADPSRTVAAAGPGAPAESVTEPATIPAVSGPPGGIASTPHRSATALPPLRSHLAATATSHASQTRRLSDRRYATLARTARPTDHAAGKTLTPPRQVSPLLAGRYGAYAQPGWVYAQAPAATYYPYAGYPGYPPSYAYYYPRYQYYRFY